MRRIATAVCAGVFAALLVPGSAVAAFGPAGSFGGPGSGDGQFNHPQGVAVDSSSRIYVVDAGNARVERFSPAGVFQTAYTASPNFAPQDVAVDAVGNVYIASPSRIDVFSALGVPLTHWQPAGTAYGIAVDSGTVYVSDAANNQIHKYGLLGSDMGAFGSAGSGPGQLLAPQGLTTGPGGVYVADPINSRVERFDSSGTPTGDWWMPSYTVVAGGTFSVVVYPQDVAVDAGGRVFAPDAGTHSNLVAV